MNLTEFYPTPPSLIEKMLDGISPTLINTILEPSAGKGDIVKAVADWLKRERRYYEDFVCKIDCIEIEENLRHILTGSGYRVVHDDFLTYHTRKQYDLIIMNPPFSDGDKHLMKALELQELGGRIVCLLNAETLRNPYTNLRKSLLRRLNELDADIEYLESEFTSAERTTDVEVALVKVTIPDAMPDSQILENLERAKMDERRDSDEPDSIVQGDFITGIIERYRHEVDAGIRLIQEYTALQPYIKQSLNDEYNISILELKLTYPSNDGLINGYVRAVRLKYWKALFEAKEFVGKLTSNLQTELFNRVSELGDYEFSAVNILTIRAELSKKTVKSIEDTILKLFDDLSGRHAYSDDIDSGNIHYFDGWKTNKAWKINKKVIIPFYGAFSQWSGKFEGKYGVRSKLTDIEKCLDFLDAGMSEAVDIDAVLDEAEATQQTRNIKFKYFDATFYKKGTCHLTFTNDDLLAKFNIFGSQRKGWLPPTYGKSAYKDMDAEAQAVVDAFEGEKSYDRVMASPERFIVPTTGVSLLGGI